jgi:hypothetical protein
VPKIVGLPCEESNMPTNIAIAVPDAKAKKPSGGVLAFMKNPDLVVVVAVAAIGPTSWLSAQLPFSMEK